MQSSAPLRRPQVRLNPQKGRPQAYVPILAILAGFLVVDQVRAVWGFGRHQTDEDQALLWLAGRDIFHFDFHEPNFFGQNYNTTFESIPGQLFHVLGMSYGLASPLGTALIFTGCWIVLSVGAFLRHNYVASAAALALPVCLPIPYLLLVDAPRGIMAGDFLAALCVASAVLVRQPTKKLALVLCFGVLAFLWDNATALAVTPAIAGGVLSCWPDLIKSPSKTLGAAGTGLAAPVVWWGFDHWWYASHPIDFTAVSVSSGASVSTLGHNLGSLGRFFAFYEPQVWQHLAVLLIFLIALLVFGLYSGATRSRPAAGFASLGLLLAILATLSVRETLNWHAGLYLSAGRFFLPLPLGIWCVFAFATESPEPKSARQRRRDRRPLKRAVAIQAIFLFTLASFISAQVLFGKTASEITAADRFPGAVVETIDPSALIEQCSNLAAVYRHVRAQIVVTTAPDFAYGCEASEGISTLDVVYDRRGWVLQAAETDPITRILLEGLACSSQISRAGTCVNVSGGDALLETAAEPLSTSLARAGMPVLKNSRPLKGP